ncbi:hypothetical protein NV391_11675 [Companilactobacillus crustorum]|uniref:hypothetical protein n=1 Tax=Companilactobacillus crustorum TaxID=392416 RepID=UPI00237D4970|nr:hypothetical protein [Companilactobacillus crustorum]WDT65599.1 hypothetical protein NV391_11675 [Companilactobacillus crustorum]
MVILQRQVITFYLVKGAIDTNSFETSGRAYSLDPNTDNGTVTYVQKVHIDPISGVNEKHDTPVVIAGTTSDDPALTSVDGDSLTLGSGDDAVNLIDTSKGSGIDFGTEYYSDNNLSTSADLNTARTVYRTITYHLNGDPSTINWNGTDATVNADNSVTFVQAITVNPIVKAAADVKVADLDVKVGDSGIQNGTDGDSIISDNETALSDAGITFGNRYYNTAQLAYDKDSTNYITVINSNNNTFSIPGTYYRTITFNLKKSSDSYEFTPSINGVGYKADGNTVTYVQKVVIQGTEAKITVDPLNVNLGESTADDAVTTNATYSIKDSAGNALPQNITNTLTSGSVISDKYYGTPQDALDSLDQTKTVSDVNSSITADGKFSKSGTYYRLVKITKSLIPGRGYSFTGENSVQSTATLNSHDYYYVQSVNANDPKPATEVGIKDLTVLAGTKTDGNDTTGASLSDTSAYDLTDGTNSIVDNSNGDGVTFSGYYADKELTTPLNPTNDVFTTTPDTYYRKITFKVKTGDGAAYTYANGTVNGDTVTYIQKVNVVANPVTATITSPSVSYNTSADSSSLKDPTGVTLKDIDGNDINSGTPSLSGIFSSKDAANKATSDAGDETGNLKAGTYYQRVTFPLAENISDAYDFGDGVVAKDGKSVTYIRTITVKPSTGGNTGNNTGNNDNGNGNGTGDEDEWTYYEDSGVVTTKITQPSYTLNNRANKTVKNRALSEDTSWITDQYRTNREGVKQYRVATGEWIDSNDVYFAEKPIDNEDDWTYYQDPGVVRTLSDKIIIH